MKAGKTLQELAMELDRQQAVKKDMIVDMGRCPWIRAIPGLPSR